MHRKFGTFFVFCLRQENQKSLYLLIKISFLFVCFRFLVKYSQRPWDCMCMPQHKKKYYQYRCVAISLPQSQAQVQAGTTTTRQGLGKKREIATRRKSQMQEDTQERG